MAARLLNEAQARLGLPPGAFPFQWAGRSRGCVSPIPGPGPSTATSISSGSQNCSAVAVGGVLAERFCVYINVIVPSSMRRGKTSPKDLNALRAPFRGLQARRAMQVLPWAITGSEE